MARTKRTTERPAITVEDEAGVAWQAEADARWAASSEDAPYQAPPLPTFPAPAFVKRAIMGRFLVDRDRKLVHDLSTATEACAIDAITRGSWVHFAHELGAAADPCPLCLSEVS